MREFVLVFAGVIGAEMDLSCCHGGAEFLLGSAEDAIFGIEFQDAVIDGERFYA